MSAFYLCNGNTITWLIEWISRNLALVAYAKDNEYADAGFHHPAESCEELRGFDEESWREGEAYCLHIPIQKSTVCKFRLCQSEAHVFLLDNARKKTATTELQYDDPLTQEESMQALLARWGVPYEDVEELRFHHHDEDCSAQRPLAGPIIDRVFEGVRLGLCIHLLMKSALERRVISRRSQKTAVVDCSLSISLDLGGLGGSKDMEFHIYDFTLHTGVAISDIPELMQAEVGGAVKIMANQDIRARRLLDLKSGFRYPYWTRIRCSSLGDAWLGLEGRNLPIDVVGDLFEDPEKPGTLELAVVITKESIISPYDSYADATNPIQPVGKAMIRLRSSDSNPRQCQFNVRRSGVVLQWSLFDDRPIKALRVPVFDFGDFCIDQGYEEVDRETQSVLNSIPPANMQRIKKNLVSRRPAGSGDPVRPIYTFNTFRPKLFGLGVPSLPAGGITVALHFVENLTVSSERPLELPLDFVTVLNEAKLLDNVEGTVLTRLLESLHLAFPDAVHRDRSGGRLFRKPLIGAWTLALWVMPQTPGELKLYRLVSDGKQSGRRTLLSFLNPQLVAKETLGCTWRRTS
ncbi:hypothetical protein LTR08_000053 [Meristemomyces frigidus]|nr:hypothetical protein LTR08_000053 [Meristemomyces frigidus]